MTNEKLEGWSVLLAIKDFPAKITTKYALHLQNGYMEKIDNNQLCKDVKKSQPSKLLMGM